MIRHLIKLLIKTQNKRINNEIIIRSMTCETHKNKCSIVTIRKNINENRYYTNIAKDEKKTYSFNLIGDITM